jgi:hypothetical protein
VVSGLLQEYCIIQLSLEGLECGQSPGSVKRKPKTKVHQVNVQLRMRPQHRMGTAMTAMTAVLGG